MNSEDRRAAIAAYKERKTTAGIYAVRCRASGQTWVGQSPNLDGVENRIWFTLRRGQTPHRGLAEAWSAHGADAFTFTIVERLAEQETVYLRTALLKARLRHWQAALDAQVL